MLDMGVRTKMTTGILVLVALVLGYWAGYDQATRMYKIAAFRRTQIKFKKVLKELDDDET